MKLVLMAAAGGAIGAAGRYLVNLGAARWLGADFPWGTLTVNVLGSFAMGVLIESIALRSAVSQEVRVFLATGILGGFTTFSAFSLDFVSLLERRDYLSAASYLLGNVGLAIAALFLGLVLVRQILQ